MQIHATYLHALMHILARRDALESPFLCDDISPAEQPRYRELTDFILADDPLRSGMFVSHVEADGSESLTSILLPGDNNVQGYIWAWYDQNGSTHIWSHLV